MNKILKSVGKKIQKLRKKKGLTQDELSFKSMDENCRHKQNISNYETGKSNPSIVNALRIFDALDHDLLLADRAELEKFDKILEKEGLTLADFFLKL